MSHDFSRATIDNYLRQLGRAYRKLAGKTAHAEIVLIGGSAIIANYNFRNATTDIDALIEKGSLLHDAIRSVANENDLPVDWMNSDFMYTSSYSDQLRRYSRYYKTFYNVLEVRTISGEYLIAMKMRAYRYYKHDISDVISIFMEQYEQGNPLSYQKVMDAYQKLYGSLDNLPANIKDQIKQYSSMTDDELESEYQRDQAAETQAAKELKELLADQPDFSDESIANTLSKDAFERVINSSDDKNER